MHAPAEVQLIAKGRFPLPEFTARVNGCQKMHQSSRAVNSGSGNRPLGQLLSATTHIRLCILMSRELLE